MASDSRRVESAAGVAGPQAGYRVCSSTSWCWANRDDRVCYFERGQPVTRTTLRTPGTQQRVGCGSRNRIMPAGNWHTDHRLVIRPAAYCGIGFKPSFGRIDPEGVITLRRR
jgi:hypothetical protein